MPGQSGVSGIQEVQRLMSHNWWGYNISITNTGTGTGSSYTTYEAYKEEFTLLTIEQRLKLIRSKF